MTTRSYSVPTPEAAMPAVLTAAKRAPARAVQRLAFEAYLDALIHSWMATLTVLGFTLIPLFLILDIFMMPPELLRTFAWYRGGVTVAVLVQYFIVRRTRPSRWSYLHGYVFSTITGGMIVQMTRDLGGFNSDYYAGLNLVIVAVNLLLPWRAIHSAVNALIVLAMYIAYDALFGGPFESSSLVNNLYFMGATSVIAVAINYTKHRLISQEYHLRAELLDANERLDRSRKDLKSARDRLWSEMEVAQRIQTALLPRNRQLGAYEVMAVMQPATEVGGDYYDMIETATGEHWVNIGDVSGHGVESGLVMMMTQTSILSTVTQQHGLAPSSVFRSVNRVLHENISRLHTNKYMTLNVIRLDQGQVVLAGKHQDLLVWRAATAQVETVVTNGCWIGMVKDTDGIVDDLPVPMAQGDVMLLFTDGVTEATALSGEMYGQDRLVETFAQLAPRPLEVCLQGLLDEVRRFSAQQDDDITLVLLRHV
ncbi:MAG TPA: PP2C family protein-serine/threonine phosphatase [Myxococcaceae bacterium]|jgi:serine phosphatase RsbU (regulator of sigma subunit)